MGSEFKDSREHAFESHAGRYVKFHLIPRGRSTGVRAGKVRPVRSGQPQQLRCKSADPRESQHESPSAWSARTICLAARGRGAAGSQALPRCCWPHIFLLSDRAILAAQSPTEYQVKAAYLFNFLKFVEWPDDPAADPHGKWVIGIVGDSPFGGELTQLVEGKDVQGRELQVKKFQAAENLRACNILFISESEKKRVPSILAALHGSSVLTVADMDNFIGSGGMIQFVMEDARVRLAIDVGAASRARLKVSSKLLSLAHAVTGTERSANN